MRTETKTRTLYKFNELSEKAKDYAVNKNRETAEYFWADYAIESLKAGIEHFGATLQNYSIDFYNCGHSDITLRNVPEYEEDELKELIENMGSYNPETLRGNGECKFTGYCMDEDFCDGVRIAFYKDGEKDLKELLESGFYTWLKAAQKDYEYQVSMEGFNDEADSNDYEFTEDGELA